MKQLAVPLLAIGSLIQVIGVIYAFAAFEEPNWPVLIGALVVGTILEILGMMLRGAGG